MNIMYVRSAFGNNASLMILILCEKKFSEWLNTEYLLCNDKKYFRSTNYIDLNLNQNQTQLLLLQFHY